MTKGRGGMQHNVRRGAGWRRWGSRGQQTLVVSLAMVGLAACSRFSVTSTHDAQANFAALRTYAWTSGPQRSIGDPRIDEALLDAAIRHAADDELKGKGYDAAPDGTADFLVDYDVVVRNKSSSVTASVGGGYRSGWSWWNPVTYSEAAYEQGSLRLRVLDPATSGVLWQGTADAVVDYKASDEKRGARVRRAVARILQGFPPQ